jgi:hypothetical protein
VRGLGVLVRRSASAELQLTFRLHGDISRIRVSPPGVPRFTRELWRHTCFEAFIAVEGQPTYHEFNFSPSGEWAVYAFSSYRNGSPIADEILQPQIATRSTDNQLELDACVRLYSISAIHPHAALRIGLSAVIEASEAFSYWALCHPADKPDFHNADGFTLLSEPPTSES